MLWRDNLKLFNLNKRASIIFNNDWLLLNFCECCLPVGTYKLTQSRHAVRNIPSAFICNTDLSCSSLQRTLSALLLSRSCCCYCCCVCVCVCVHHIYSRRVVCRLTYRDDVVSTLTHMWLSHWLSHVQFGWRQSDVLDSTRTTNSRDIDAVVSVLIVYSAIISRAQSARLSWQKFLLTV